MPDGLAIDADGVAQALDEARAELQARRASLALARARLDKTQIRAPYDGLLGLRQVSPGDYLEAGQDIVNLEVLDPLKLDFRVPQKAVGQVRPGQVVEIRLDAFADEVFRGRISAINPQLDVAGRSQAIRAQLSNPGLRLKPGQFVRVTVILAERPQALLIPEEAVMPLGERLLVNLVVDGRVEQREIRRAAGRHAGWNINITDGIRYGNIAPYNLSWLSSQKHCQGVSLKGVLLAKPRKLRLCSGKLGFCLPQGQFINLASFKQGPLQSNRFAAGRYGAFRDLNLTVKGSQIEVTLGHLTNHG